MRPRRQVRNRQRRLAVRVQRRRPQDDGAVLERDGAGGRAGACGGTRHGRQEFHRLPGSRGVGAGRQRRARGGGGGGGRGRRTGHQPALRVRRQRAGRGGVVQQGQAVHRPRSCAARCSG